MILQTLNSINIRKVKFFTDDYRFKHATILGTQYKLHHHIRFVLVNISGVRTYMKMTYSSQTLNQTSSMYGVNTDTKRKATQLLHL